MLVIHKLLRKHPNKDSITKHVLKGNNEDIIMLNCNC